MSLCKEKILIICDFDGTICTVDMGNILLNRFTDEGWEEIDRDYCAGRIGSRVAYTRIANFFRGNRTQLLDYVSRHAVMDPHFPSFCRFCSEQGIEVKIASDGLDFYIEAILQKSGLSYIEYFANAAVFGEGERMDIAFPRMNEACGKCGTCKSGIVHENRPAFDRVFYIGNGYSDVCPSKNVDLVFAKDVLYERCIQEGRPCIHYNNFGDVQSFLLRHFDNTRKPSGAC